jgi:biotin synthase
MVTEIRGMGMEVCTTLGMLTPEQARQLKEAGLTGMISNCDLLTTSSQNNGSIQP